VAGDSQLFWSTQAPVSGRMQPVAAMALQQQRRTKLLDAIMFRR
jgi:hypothetical protein